MGARAHEGEAPASAAPRTSASVAARSARASATVSHTPVMISIVHSNSSCLAFGCSPSGWPRPSSASTSVAALASSPVSRSTISSSTSMPRLGPGELLKSICTCTSIGERDRSPDPYPMAETVPAPHRRPWLRSGRSSRRPVGSVQRPDAAPWRSLDVVLAVHQGVGAGCRHGAGRSPSPPSRASLPRRRTARRCSPGRKAAVDRSRRDVAVGAAVEQVVLAPAAQLVGAGPRRAAVGRSSRRMVVAAPRRGTTSLPAPPLTVSLPSPPQMVSSPPLPLTVSLPPRATITSLARRAVDRLAGVGADHVAVSVSQNSERAAPPTLVTWPLTVPPRSPRSPSTKSSVSTPPKPDSPVAAQRERPPVVRRARPARVCGSTTAWP